MLETVQEQRAEGIGDEVAKIEATTLDTLFRARLELVRAGAAAKAISAGVIEQLHPLEDFEEMRAANPAQNGKLVRDQATSGLGKRRWSRTCSTVATSA